MVSPLKCGDFLLRLGGGDSSDPPICNLTFHHFFSNSSKFTTKNLERTGKGAGILPESREIFKQHTTTPVVPLKGPPPALFRDYLVPWFDELQSFIIISISICKKHPNQTSQVSKKKETTNLPTLRLCLPTGRLIWIRIPLTPLWRIITIIHDPHILDDPPWFPLAGYRWMQV